MASSRKLLYIVFFFSCNYILVNTYSTTENLVSSDSGTHPYNGSSEFPTVGIPDYGWQYACQSSSSLLELSEVNGVLSSPYFGNPYPPYATCQWRIDSSNSSSYAQASKIRIEFEYFQTELNRDYLYIYNGPSSSYPNLRVMSGYYSPGDYLDSSNPAMYLRFTSDYSTNYYNGFLAKYNADPACRNTGGVLILEGGTQTTGQFSSPYYNYYYGNNDNCTWVFRTLLTGRIHISIPTFYTQYGYDLITIYQGSTLYATLSGQSSFTAMLNFYEVTVNFKTDGSSVYPGFTGTYTIYPPSLPAIKTMLPPSIAITVNGTVTTSGSFSEGCELFYFQQMKISAQTMTTSLNQAIEARQLCSNIPSAAVQWQYTTFERHETISNQARVFVDIDLPAVQGYTIYEMQSCANDLYNFIRYKNNWPQPIIPNQEGCPTVNFGFTYFDDGGTQWCKLLRELNTNKVRTQNEQFVTFFPPSITIPMKTYLTTSSSLTDECELAYDDNWVTATQTMTSIINVHLNKGEMCDIGVASGMTLLWQIAEAVKHQSNQLNLTLIIDLPGLTQVRLEQMDRCATNILNYISDFSNWPQPALPTPPGCPSIYTYSSMVDDGMIWCMPPPVLPEKRHRPKMSSAPAAYLTFNLLLFIGCLELLIL